MDVVEAAPEWLTTITVAVNAKRLVKKSERMYVMNANQGASESVKEITEKATVMKSPVLVQEMTVIAIETIIGIEIVSMTEDGSETRICGLLTMVAETTTETETVVNVTTVTVITKYYEEKPEQHHTVQAFIIS